MTPPSEEKKGDSTWLTFFSLLKSFRLKSHEIHTNYLFNNPCKNLAAKFYFFKVLFSPYLLKTTQTKNKDFEPYEEGEGDFSTFCYKCAIS